MNLINRPNCSPLHAINLCRCYTNSPFKLSSYLQNGGNCSTVTAKLPNRANLATSMSCNNPKLISPRNAKPKSVGILINNPFPGHSPPWLWVLGFASFHLQARSSIVVNIEFARSPHNFTTPSCICSYTCKMWPKRLFDDWFMALWVGTDFGIF